MDVIIGIDPHKSSHTAVALDAAGKVLDELRVTAGKHQIRELQTFQVVARSALGGRGRERSGAAVVAAVGRCR
jgi:transposase